MVMAVDTVSFVRNLEILAIVLCIGLAGLAVFYFAGNKAYNITDPFAKTAKDKLDRSGIAVTTENLIVAILVGSVVLWGLIMFFVRPPLILGFGMLPMLLVVMFKLVDKWVDIKIAKRQAKFVNQLELVLRMMSGAIRAGMGNSPVDDSRHTRNARSGAL